MGKLVSGCWEWTGTVDKNGYGMMAMKTGGKWAPMYSHRAAWTFSRGPIPAGLFVLHHCDNPLCCNPGHLFIGTQADNMRDMAEKGRAKGKHVNFENVRRGQRHWRAKLTEPDVLAIRARYLPGSRASLAREYGVHPQTISAIANRRVWKHL